MGGSGRCRQVQGCGFVRYARETFPLGYGEQRRWRKEQKTSAKAVSISVGGTDLPYCSSRTKTLNWQKHRTQKNGSRIFLSIQKPREWVPFGTHHL